MLELLALTLAAAQPAAGNVTEVSPPTDIASLDLAKFRKPVKYADRHSIQAEKAARKDNCSLPIDEFQWIHARIEAAIYVSAMGDIEKVMPISVGCQALEEFMGQHLVKFAKNIAPIPPNGKAKWYRTAMHFRWPE
ncbi:MAG: hypothetical protein ABJN65_16050 [Parasphingorhabdus sp.]